MKTLAYVLAGVGGLLALCSFFFDTAPEGTHNIGLLQNQMMIFSLGGVLLVAGTILGSVAYALARMEESGLLLPKGHTPVAARTDSQPGE